jgi:hypothetical protein
VGVVDGFWWSVQWPWMLLWIATAAGLMSSAGLLVAGHRRDRRRRLADAYPVTGFCVYVNAEFLTDSVGDQLQQGVHVEKTETVTGRLGASVGLPFLGSGADGGREVSVETVRSYVEDGSLLKAVSTLMEVLNARDKVIYVDLDEGRVIRNHAAVNVLATARDGGGTIRLSALRDFVWVEGDFTRVPGEDTPGRTVFRVPYGPGPDGAQVEIACVTGELRRETPGKAFRARCLGVVETWDPDGGRLHVEPIAILK